MDYLWTPWRYAYISTVDAARECVLCTRPREADREALIIHRARHCYVILNVFPYTSGHVMVVPHEHLDQLQKLAPEAAAEMMELARKLEGILRRVYRPDGINLGMNLGRAAGAGLAGHIHMHVLPRWSGDANFMTTVGETRILPETLEQSWEKLRAAWENSS
jgi:ATP adenylyltransferase